MIGVMRRLSLGLAVTGAVLAAAAPGARADVTAQYFTLPDGFAAASGGLAVAPDGTVYFGAGDGFNQEPPIGRVNPAQVVPGTASGITGITTPDAPGCCAAGFRDMSWSTRDDRLYFTRSDNTVGAVVSGTAPIAPVPVAPWGIVAAPDGGAWMTEYGTGPQTPDPADRAGSRIARVSSSLGLDELPNIQTFPGVYSPARFDAKPRGITVAPDGTPWFTEADNGNPGYRVAKVAGNGYVEYSAPCVAQSPCSGSFTGTGLTDVAVDQTGAVWYTNELKRVVTRLVPDIEQTEYPLGGMSSTLANGTPRAITAAADGSLWLAVSGGFSSPGANAIVRIDPATRQAAIYPLGAAGAPFDVEPDLAHGHVWFVATAGTGGGALGRLTGFSPIVEPPAGGGGGDPAPGGGGGGVSTPPTTTTLQPGTTGSAKVTNPVVRGESISANQICVGPPEDRCSLVYLIQTHEYVKGFPGTRGLLAAKPKKKVLTTVGQLKVTLKGGEQRKVTVKLNSKGKKLLKKIKRFKATFTVTQSRSGAKPKTVLKKTVRFKR